MESRHFSETETFAMTQVSRHETSQSVKDWDETGMLLKCLRLRYCQGTVIKIGYIMSIKQQPQNNRSVVSNWTASKWA